LHAYWKRCFERSPEPATNRPAWTDWWRGSGSKRRWRHRPSGRPARRRRVCGRKGSLDLDGFFYALTGQSGAVECLKGEGLRSARGGEIHVLEAGAVPSIPGDLVTMISAIVHHFQLLPVRRPHHHSRDVVEPVGIIHDGRQRQDA